MKQLTELELALYGELGEWADKYARWFLHSKEHQALATKLAIAVLRLKEYPEGENDERARI